MCLNKDLSGSKVDVNIPVIYNGRLSQSVLSTVVDVDKVHFHVAIVPSDRLLQIIKSKSFQQKENLL